MPQESLTLCEVNESSPVERFNSFLKMGKRNFFSIEIFVDCTTLERERKREREKKKQAIKVKRIRLTTIRQANE